MRRRRRASSVHGVIGADRMRARRPRPRASKPANCASRSRLRRVGKMIVARPASASARTLRGGRPEQADVLGLVDLAARRRRRAGARGRSACRRSACAHAPAASARNSSSASRSSAEPAAVERRAERVAGVQRGAHRGERRRRRASATRPIGSAGFLDRLADRGDARGGSRRRRAERRRQRMVAGIDAAAGEHQRAARERHRLGALDHQQFGRRRRRGRGRCTSVAAGMAGGSASVIGFGNARRRDRVASWGRWRFGARDTCDPARLTLFSREGGSPVWVPAFAGKQGDARL